MDELRAKEEKASAESKESWSKLKTQKARARYLSLSLGLRAGRLGSHNTRCSQNDLYKARKELQQLQRNFDDAVRCARAPCECRRAADPEQEFNYKRWVDHVKWERRQAQRIERQQRWEEEQRAREAEKVEEVARHPYEIELYYCEELTRYLNRLLPKVRRLGPPRRTCRDSREGRGVRARTDRCGDQGGRAEGGAAELRA